MVEAHEPVAAVDGHADGVEADRAGRRPPAAAFAQPGEREAPKPGLLARAQGAQRRLVRAEAHLPSTRAPRLDLREYECAAVECDQVDLPITAARVALEHSEAEALEMSGRERLAERPQRAAAFVARA